MRVSIALGINKRSIQPINAKTTPAAFRRGGCGRKKRRRGRRDREDRMISGMRGNGMKMSEDEVIRDRGVRVNERRARKKRGRTGRRRVEKDRGSRV